MAINVVWFKRDLRLSDHEPLKAAISTGRPTLLWFNFEPWLVNDPHYDERHWRFIVESIRDINRKLKAYNTQIYVTYGDTVEQLQIWHQQFSIESLYSHQEVGLLNTFDRDKQVASWCRQHHVNWFESPTGAVQRGLNSRQQWQKHWYETMKAPLATPDLARIQPVKAVSVDYRTLPKSWFERRPSFQYGGPAAAWATLNSFLEQRGRAYHYSISQPIRAQHHCSRLSPYLAWGNLSLRECYQATVDKRRETGWKRPLNAFLSRLHWHCHFIQKFESETAMQHAPLNRAYENYPYRSDTQVEQHLKAWQQGKTGYPMVDAAMRCLLQTGYINFRMRALLVSFLCHYLHIHWQYATTHLAALFLDFEPGIHYPQIQMQAGIIGTNTIRMYNPEKQAIEKDPTGEYIDQWVPELAELPLELKHAPYRITPMEAQMYGFKLGEDYPSPIVDVDEYRPIARDTLYRIKKSVAGTKEAQRILKRHVVSR